MPRYYCPSRPPVYACVPDGWVESCVWMPMQSIPEHPGWDALGWVEYAESLGVDKIMKWELLPADKVEWSELMLARRARDWHDSFEDVVTEYEQSVADYGLAYMQGQAKHDRVAEAFLIWRSRLSQ